MRERWSKDIVAVQCGELHLDLVHRRAMLGDAPMHLPPRIIDLLAFFLAAPDQLHSREAILADVWEGLVVEEGSLGQAVWLLRKALGPVRRDSLQSVPKRGYVFHPWAKIVSTRNDHADSPMPAARLDPSEQQVAAEVASGMQLLHPEPATPRTVRRQARGSSGVQDSAFGRIGLAALLLIAVVALGFLAEFRPVESAPAHRTIALWVKPTPEGANRERELALLLEDWLEYRLAASAENLVLTEADLDEEEAYTPTVTLMLSVVPVAADSRKLKARIEVLGEGAGPGSNRIEGVITESSLDTDTQRFADNVIRRIDVRTVSSSSASFSVGKARASYAQALRANKDGLFEEALQHFERALLEAPSFAPIRLRLARAQTLRGEMLSANENYRAAMALDSSWKADSPYVLELEDSHANTDAERKRVIERYRRLYAENHARPDLLLNAIRVEMPPLERQALLKSINWSALPTSIEREAKLAECWVLLHLRRLKEAEDCGMAMVQEMGSASSLGVRSNLGGAKAVIAYSRWGMGIESPDLSEFIEAAAAMRSAGRILDALRLEAAAEIYLGHPGRDPMLKFEALTEVIRENQLRSIEVALYRNVAQHLLYLGDMRGSLQYLEQAERAAAIYGDTRDAALVTLQLIHQYWSLGNLSAVEESLNDLSGLDLDPDLRASRVAKAARLVWERGSAREAADLLERELSSLGRRGGNHVSESGLADLRLTYVDALIAQGKFEKAETELSSLGSVETPHLAGAVSLMQAQLMLHSGRPDDARQIMLAETSKPDFNTGFAVSFAAVAVAVGSTREAELLASSALDYFNRGGNIRGADFSRLVIAQVAASRGDWGRVEELRRAVDQSGGEKGEYIDQQLDLLGLLAVLAQLKPGGHESADFQLRMLLGRAASNCDLYRAAPVLQVLRTIDRSSQVSFPSCSSWPEMPAARYNWIHSAIKGMGEEGGLKNQVEHVE